MTTETIRSKPDLLVVGGTWDHTPQAAAFYGQVVEIFSSTFNTRQWLPQWVNRPGDSVGVVQDMIGELGAEADGMARPSVLGLSIGGTLALAAFIDNPSRYDRVFALAARTNPEGLEGLKSINPAGATTVTVFDRNRGRLLTPGLSGRVATGLRADGDSRVSLSACEIQGVQHFPFQGVSRDHVRGTSEIATKQPHVQTIADFLRNR